MKEMYWVGAQNSGSPPKITRKQRKLKKSTYLNSSWMDFLLWVNACFGQPGIALMSNVRGILAYSFEREGFPEGDEFDRMRVRVTGAMPKEFKLKLIEEVKAGKRHMRMF